MFPISGHPTTKDVKNQVKKLKDNDLTLAFCSKYPLQTTYTRLIKAYFSELLHRPPIALGW